MLGGCGLHVCASDVEGWGQVVIDAAAHGIPTDRPRRARAARLDRRRQHRMAGRHDRLDDGDDSSRRAGRPDAGGDRRAGRPGASRRRTPRAAARWAARFTWDRMHDEAVAATVAARAGPLATDQCYSFVTTWSRARCRGRVRAATLSPVCGGQPHKRENKDTMRRILGPLLVGVGCFLIVAALLVRFYAYPKLAVAPVNQNSVTKLQAEGATFFNTSHPRPRSRPTCRWRTRPSATSRPPRRPATTSASGTARPRSAPRTARSSPAARSASPSTPPAVPPSTAATPTPRPPRATARRPTARASSSSSPSTPSSRPTSGGTARSARRST